MKIRAILDFFRDSIELIMISLGIFSIFVALLLLTRVYQYGSSALWLLGVTLIIIGIVLYFESFQWKVPSVKGFGTLLICISFVFVAVAVVAIFFAVPRGLFIQPGDPLHPRPNSDTLIISMPIERPYVWLAAPLMLTCLGLLAFGFLLRFVDDIL